MIGYRKCLKKWKEEWKENREHFRQREEEKQKFSNGDENILKGKEVKVLDGVYMRVLINEWIKLWLNS